MKIMSLKNLFYKMDAISIQSCRNPIPLRELLLHPFKKKTIRTIHHKKKSHKTQIRSAPEKSSKMMYEYQVLKLQ